MHLSEADILLYLENKLTVEKRSRVEAHIGDCVVCAEQFAALARLPEVLEQDVPLSLDVATRQRAESFVQDKLQCSDVLFSFFRRPPGIAFAIFAAAAIGVTAYIALQKQQPETFRTSKSNTTIELLSPTDGAIVQMQRISFTWKATASPYTFILYDDRGVIVWSKQTPDTMLTLPNDMELERGKIYFWGVESSFSQQEVERSALHAFTFNPTN